MEYYDIVRIVFTHVGARTRGTLACVSRMWYYAFLKTEPELFTRQSVNVTIHTRDHAIFAVCVGDLIKLYVGGRSFEFYIGKHRNVPDQVKVAGFWTVRFGPFAAACEQFDITPRTAKNMLMLVFCMATMGHPPPSRWRRATTRENLKSHHISHTTMMLLALIITAVIATPTNAAAATCSATPRKFTNTPADTVILEVYDPSTDCGTVTNTKMRAKWSDDEYDLTGYDCDHIIDLKNVPGLPDNCGRDIVANKIPAASWWNRALGTMCWDHVVVEKRRLYGDMVVDNALAAVKRCCSGAPPPATTPTDNTSIIFMGCIAGAVFVFVVVACVVIVVKDKCARPQLAPVVV